MKPYDRLMMEYEPVRGCGEMEGLKDGGVIQDGHMLNCVQTLMKGW